MILKSQIIKSTILALSLLLTAKSQAQDYTVDVPVLAVTDINSQPLDVGASTQPSSTNISTKSPEQNSAKSNQFPGAGTTFGLEEFIAHFAPHEPMYFVGGWTSPNIKFQFSIRYRILTPTGPLATKFPFFKGFNFAYTQTSFWDFSDPNRPFFYDTSYKPEALYYLEQIPGLKLPKAWQLGAQVAVQHESNGLHDPDHRSLNIVYFRPIFTAAADNGLFLTLAPKFYGYIGDLSLNKDIARYRGYCDFKIVTGLRDSLQLATIGRVGNHWNRGSVQFDLTYPLTKLFNGNTDLSLDAQYFYGYGDSLIDYNKKQNVFRFGLAIVR